MAEITVVIPTYNGEKWITRCLDSLRAQTFRDFCVLVIDDGSTDGTVRVIREYQKNVPDLPIEVVLQSNSGVSRTRNRGISMTTTAYITFMDQDDCCGPDYLKAYAAAMRDENADIVCGGYERLNESGKCQRRVILGKDPWAKFVVVSPWAHLYRTAFLREHEIGYLPTGIGEDVYFSLLAYAYTDRIVTIPDHAYFWMNNPQSVSNAKQDHVNAQADPFVLLDALDTHLPDNNRIPHEWMEYYLYRYIVWYLLYTVRHSPKSLVTSQYDRLLAWLTARNPTFQNNPNISLFRPAGEPLSIRASVFGFTLLYRLHLSLPVLQALSRRDEGDIR